LAKHLLADKSSDQSKPEVTRGRKAHGHINTDSRDAEEYSNPLSSAEEGGFLLFEALWLL
jgi:hypothetical protein